VRSVAKVRSREGLAGRSVHKRRRTGVSCRPKNWPRANSRAVPSCEHSPVAKKRVVFQKH